MPSSDRPPPARPPAGQRVEVLRRMWLIRHFEEAAIRLYGEGRYRGSTHPYIAQEATALAVCAALRPTDTVLATYRGHGAAIAAGCDVTAMMAELLGKESGLCKGKGGSMHFSHAGDRLFGCNAIVSGQIPMAGGMALATRIDGGDAVTVVFFGDGASCEGVFYETLNMAALWKLPLVLVCENNEYAISTHYTQAVSVPRISDRAQGFGLPGVHVDGCDYDAVHDAAAAAVERARAGGGPTLIEAKTVRWTRHSAVAAGGSSEGAEQWRETDPIPRFTDLAIAEGALDAAAADRIRGQAQAEVERAVEAALAAPYPPLAALTADVFA